MLEAKHYGVRCRFRLRRGIAAYYEIKKVMQPNVLQQRLTQLEPAAAAAEASNAERARRIEALERQHQAKARECLSFAAEKATSSIQRTSKDGASDRLLAQVERAGTPRQRG